MTFMVKEWSVTDDECEKVCLFCDSSKIHDRRHSGITMSHFSVNIFIIMPYWMFVIVVWEGMGSQFGN